VAEEAPLTNEQRIVLQAIYDKFRDLGTWPPFVTIDRPLRRTSSIDVGAIVQSIPNSLLITARPGNLRPIASDELRLTIRGISRCDAGQEDAACFFRLLRWFAQREIEADPSEGGEQAAVRITSEEVRRYLRLAEGNNPTLNRLYAMLQLENWGQEGSGSGADGWYVNVGSNVWRFRDVQTVDDFEALHEAWRRESPMYQAARRAVSHSQVTAVESGEPEAAVYYHVRISVKSHPTWDEVALDVSSDRLESQFLAPYREGRAIVVNGSTISITDLVKIRVNKSEQPSSELLPIVREERRKKSFIAVIPENWLVASHCDEVTDEFIVAPPGSAHTSAAAELIIAPLDSVADDRVGLVFVHGFLSGPEVWEPFQRIIAEDPELGFVKALPFKYSSQKFSLSPLRSIPPYEVIADSLMGYLEVEASAYRNVVLVSHSQGGLIVQRYLHRMLSEGRGLELERIRQIVLFACPNAGSEIALSMRRKWMSNNAQEKQLRPLNLAVTEAHATVVNRVVHAVEVRADTCPIPIAAYAGETDNIVVAASAQSVFRDKGVLPGDHFQIIRPDGAGHRSYTTLKKKLLDTRSRIAH
jgi:hypothetical protein